MFTAYCPELDVASCGHTPEEAKKNLGEVIVIQLEETTKLGMLKDFLSLSTFPWSVENTTPILQTLVRSDFRNQLNRC